MKEIPLTQGQVALVDDEDYFLVSDFYWFAHGKGRYVHAATNIKVGGCRRTLLMHRLILGAQDDEHVDHRNGNELDNRRQNLRLCTHTENMANRRCPSNSTSGFKGVSRFGDRWRARIGVNGRRLSLGLFDTPEAAQEAFRVAAIQYCGEFANYGQEML